MIDVVNLHDTLEDPEEPEDPFPGVLKGHSARRKWWIFGGVVVAVAICGGLIGGLTSMWQKNIINFSDDKAPSPSSPQNTPASSGDSAPNPSPTAADEADIVDRPTAGNTQTVHPTSSIYNYIKSIAPDGGFSIDFFPDSYQYKAFQWVNGNCENCESSERVLQRYVLACIYFATNAVSSPYTDYELGVGQKVFPWYNSQGWLESDDECLWTGIHCNKNGLVDKIDLHDNFLTGMFPPETALLKNSLTYFDIGNNLVYNVDEEVEWLGDLKLLETLNIAQTPFEYVGIPPSIGKLTNLAHLDVSYTLFFGPLQREVFENLHNVQYLYIGGNSYNSSIPDTVGEMENLLYFYAEYSDIDGDLSFMTTMAKVFELWADKNPKLKGTIPPEIGDLTTLESLSLSNCGLTGPIPVEIGGLYRMQQMWLFGNQLEGNIPASVGNLTRMYRFEVENNLLAGDMPDEVCTLFNEGGQLEILETDCDSRITNCNCCTCCGAQCAIQASKPVGKSSDSAAPGNERQRRLQFVSEQRRRRRELQNANP